MRLKETWLGDQKDVMKKAIVLCTLPMDATSMSLIDSVAEIVVAPDQSPGALYRLIDCGPLWGRGDYSMALRRWVT